MEYVIRNMFLLIPCQQPPFSYITINFWITKTTSPRTHSPGQNIWNKIEKSRKTIFTFNFWKGDWALFYVRNPASGLLQISQKSEKWQWRHNFPARRHRQIFRTFFLFLLSSLVTGRSFMSISSLVLELWQFSFIRDWPEIRKSEIPPSDFETGASYGYQIWHECL